GRNSSKPERGEQESWVIHGSPEWTRENLDLSKEDAGEKLLDEFCRWAGILERPIRARAHRWRYAQASTKAGPDCLYDPEMGLGACGDWCHYGTVEGAWRSGFEMAKTLLK
ncbi:MAG: FAD-dependent oxidoreductase, partial [Planctomycetota bacterium]|nr:FAD-dependent oxidoreductase [Planctomycetota bacterium]